MVLRLIAASLLGIWLVLVLLGKGGFVHLLLLNGIGVAVVEIMTVIRTRIIRVEHRTFSGNSASED